MDYIPMYGIWNQRTYSWVYFGELLYAVPNKRVAEIQLGRFTDRCRLYHFEVKSFDEE